MGRPWLVSLIGAALLAGFWAPGLARADDTPAAPPPDKSGYTLFIPTPPDLERSFCTDRPTKSTGPCTVDAGHFQLESDLFNATFDRSGGVNTETYLFTNPTLKLGVTNTTDVELNIVPLEVIETRDRATGAKIRSTGVGDLYARLKFGLIGDDGGDFALAVSPFVKAPTASGGLGNGAAEAGVIVPMSFNLPMSWSLTIDPEIDVLKDISANGRHVNLAGLISFSRPVSKSLTLSVELWSDLNFDPAGTVRQYSFDLGAAWIPHSHPNLQFDGGVNLGLNDVTPAAQVYLGVSRRF